MTAQSRDEGMQTQEDEDQTQETKSAATTTGLLLRFSISDSTNCKSLNRAGMQPAGARDLLAAMC